MIDQNPAQISVLICALFPPGVSAAQSESQGNTAALYPDEMRHIARYAKKRADEFAAGRLCARRALESLGIEGFPLLIAPDRRPIWPEHVVGSITHTAGFCAAVAARRDSFISIGIDSEVVGAVSRELWKHICIPHEIAILEAMSEEESARAVTLLFGAKEVFYKCQYEIAREWLDFSDVRVSISDSMGSEGSIEIHPQRDMLVSERVAMPLVCRYRFHGRFVSVGAAMTNGTE